MIDATVADEVAQRGIYPQLHSVNGFYLACFRIARTS
jgi:hypothetical protein